MKLFQIDSRSNYRVHVFCHHILIYPIERNNFQAGSTLHNDFFQYLDMAITLLNAQFSQFWQSYCQYLILLLCLNLFIILFPKINFQFFKRLAFVYDKLYKFLYTTSLKYRFNQFDNFDFILHFSHSNTLDLVQSIGDFFSIWWFIVLNIF